MPKIPEYNQRSQVAGPLSAPGRKADPSGGDISSGLNAVASGMSDVGDAMNQKQNRDELTGFQLKRVQADAGLAARYEEKKNALSANIDPTSEEYKNFGADIQADVEKTYSELGKDITMPAAKQYFTQSLAGTQEHFFKNSAADKSELAMAGAVNAYSGSINTWGAGLLKDPAAYDTRAKALDDYVTAQETAGAVDPKTAFKLRTEGKKTLANAAIRGWVENSPEYAKQILATDRFDEVLGADGKAQAIGLLNKEERNKEREGRRRDHDLKEAAKLAEEQTAVKLVDAWAEGKLTSDMVKNSGTKATVKERFYKNIEMDMRRAQKGVNKFVSSPKVRDEMMSRMYLPDGDPKKIESVDQLMQLNGRGQVGSADMKWLVGRMDRQQTQEGREEFRTISRVSAWAKNAIIAGQKDSKGLENFYSFQRDLDKYIEEGKKKGKTLTELTDPEIMKTMIQPLVRTPVQRLKDKVKTEQNYKKKVVKVMGGGTKNDRMKSIDEILKRKGHQ